MVVTKRIPPSSFARAHTRGMGSLMGAQRRSETPLERAVRELETSVSELGAAFQRRSGNRETHRGRARAQRREEKAARPLCGARCRSRGGAPCVARVVVDRDGDGRVRVRGRCRMHGGLSTGPRTAEGRKRVSEAVRERWRRWRERQAAESMSRKENGR